MFRELSALHKHKRREDSKLRQLQSEIANARLAILGMMPHRHPLPKDSPCGVSHTTRQSGLSTPRPLQSDNILGDRKMAA
jgi:hypothetical protein